MTHRDYVFVALNEFMRGYFKGKAGRVLEVGHGGNEDFKRLFEQNGWTWEGVEPDVSVKLGKYCMSMADMSPVENDSYDVVFACHSFEHCERPVDALREFRRVLKPGGVVFIAMPNPDRHHILEADEDHIFCLNCMQMIRLLRYCGFKEYASFIQNKDIESEQDFNVISTGLK